MMFSIPYDGGWSVYVDGKKTDTYALKDALLAFDVTSGNHEITLKYTPVNLIKGCIITILCIIILIVVYLFKKMCHTGKIDTKRFPVLIQEFINEKDELIAKHDNKVIMTQAEINDTVVNDNLSINSSEPPINLDDIDDFDNIDLNDENI